VTELHVTNGDAVAPAIGPGVLVWREILCDGPVPPGMDDDELVRLRARHLARRGWTTEQAALDDLRAMRARLDAHPDDAPVVVWFEHDLFDDCLLAQVDARLAGRAGPVWRVVLPHDRRGVDLHALPRRRHVPNGEAFAALRSPQAREWDRYFPRLLEELPGDDGLGRLERTILRALDDGPLSAHDLFLAVAAQEDPPWLGDTHVWAVADDLAPLVERRNGGYARGSATGAKLPERWVGGVRVAPREVQA
jgi:hypothetical protein